MLHENGTAPAMHRPLLISFINRAKQHKNIVQNRQGLPKPEKLLNRIEIPKKRLRSRSILELDHESIIRSVDNAI